MKPGDKYVSKNNPNTVSVIKEVHSDCLTYWFAGNSAHYSITFDSFNDLYRPYREIVETRYVKLTNTHPQYFYLSRNKVPGAVGKLTLYSDGTTEYEKC